MIVTLLIAGLAQKLESLDSIRDMTRKSSDSDESASQNSATSPRPVFQAVGSRRHNANHKHIQTETITREQEELIRYVYGSK